MFFRLQEKLSLHQESKQTFHKTTYSESHIYEYRVRPSKRFLGAHTKHIISKLITTKHIKTYLISDKTYHHKTYQNNQSTNLSNNITYQNITYQLQNLSNYKTNSKLISKIHESKISYHVNVPTIV